MPKLTDTQLVILSAAASRDDHAALPLPKSLKIRGGAVTKSLDGLVRRGLLEERPVTRVAETWREKDGQRLMLVLSDAGLQAIDGGPDHASARQRKTAGKRPGAADRRSRPAKTSPRAEAAQSRNTPRAGTKLALLIDLLKRRNGATIDEVVAATGWQAHSARGAISGTLKKKFGLDVISEKVEGRGRVYRIAGRS